MSEALALTLAGAAGLALGGFFFGGLWWTVRRALASRRPGLWFLGSVLLRVLVTTAGFYLVSDRHWERLLLCLVGFIVARPLVTWMTGSSRRVGAGCAP